MKKKKKIKKIKKAIINIIIMLFTSGTIALLIQIWYSNKITEPKTWYNIDSLESMSDLRFRSSIYKYPSEISVSSYKSFKKVFKNSFLISLHIKNYSENEMILSNLKFNMTQYQYDFPIIEAVGYIDNNNFMVDIINYSAKNLTNIDVYLYDEESILQEICSGKINNLFQEIPEIKEGETKSITFFDLDDIAGKKVNSWVLKPYIIIKDSIGNTLLINLEHFSLNKDEYNSFDRKRKTTGFLVVDKYLYDITPDIIIENEEIELKEIVECIPAHETLILKLLITSQVSCAFDLQITYELDDKRYNEEEMSFIIYNPDETSKGYECTVEYIEIK